MHTTSQKELSICDLFKGDLQLSSPPNIFFELKKTIENPGKSLIDTAYIIEKDAALAIRLLKIVNSAFYGFPSQITSIGRAITLIGSKELQSIVLSTLVIDKFSDLPNELISMHDFWANNLRCALLAKEIDQFLNTSYEDAIFMCGILHHIGQLVFYRRIPELAREVNLMLQSQENPQQHDEIEFEKSVIGFNHYQTGAALCKLWKLPEIIVESIRLHEYPDDTEQFYKIAAIVRLADSYSRAEYFHYNDTSNALGISSSDMSLIIEKAYDNFEEIFKVFYPG